MRYYLDGAPTFAILMLTLVVIAVLAFEIWMLVDAVTNKRISPEERAIWVVGMLLIHPFVGIAYYFISSQSKRK